MNYREEYAKIRKTLHHNPQTARELDRLEMNGKDVQVRRWNYDKNEHENVGEPVSLYLLRRSMNEAQFAHLFDGFLNGGRDNSGYRIGLMLRKTHRTLQRLAIKFALDLLRGISKQVDGDPRNQDALNVAKEITRQYEAGELNIGQYI